MKFSDIPAHEKNKTGILSAVRNNHLSHAYLLHGADGTGKFPFALALVQYLFCENLLENDSCGICSSCKRIAKLMHPDLHFVFPFFNKGKSDFAKGESENEEDDAKSGKSVSDDFMGEFREAVTENPYLDLENWRDFLTKENKQLNIPVHEIRHLRKKMNYKSYEGKYKAAIIWHAEKMNPQASNALLKLLEEPSGETILILTTTNTELLLPTIVSRCQSLHFAPLSAKEIQNYLKKKFNLAEEKSFRIAKISGGNLNYALQLKDEVEEDISFNEFRDWMRVCLDGKPEEIVKWVQKMSELSREELKSFFDQSLHTLRESLLTKIELKNLVSIPEGQEKFLSDFGKFVLFDAMEKIYSLLNEHRYYIERNANAKIVLTVLSQSIHSALKTKVVT